MQNLDYEKKIRNIGVSSDCFEEAKDCLNGAGIYISEDHIQDGWHIIKFTTWKRYGIVKKALDSCGISFCVDRVIHSLAVSEEATNSRIASCDKQKQRLIKKFYLSGKSDLIPILDSIQNYSEEDINYAIIKYEMMILDCENKLRRLKEELSNLYKMKACKRA